MPLAHCFQMKHCHSHCAAACRQRKICLSMDDSVHSQFAMNWMLNSLIRAGDEVHVVVVALPVPYPVGTQHCIRKVDMQLTWYEGRVKQVRLHVKA